MNVIVPLGGLGTRFQNEGYTRPKPFVRVLGKEMILWVLDNLSLRPNDALVIVFNPAFLSMDVFMREVVQSRYANCTLVELGGATRGAAETVLFGLKGLPESLRARPCMLCDGDCFYTVDIVSMYREVCATHNGTFTFVDTQPKPIYSYVTVKRPGSDEVADIKEKVKISDFANTGCYCFKNGLELERYCERIIEAGAMQLSQDQKGEFYTSGVIKAMLEDRIPCKMLQLPLDSIHVLGTPTQLQQWASKWQAQPAMRMAFGVEGTLLFPGTLAPIARNVQYLTQLHHQGHHVLLCGPRSTPAARRAEIERRLTELAIPYDALEWSQPDADLLIDSRSIDAVQGDLASHVGFYATDVRCAGQPKQPQEVGVMAVRVASLTVAVAVLAAAATLLRHK
jgi:dTDP-glucose pyrophosphorylase